MADRAFWYVALAHPVPKAIEEENARSRIVAGPEIVLADNEEEAKVLAAHEVPKEELGKKERVELLVRPF